MSIDKISTYYFSARKPNSEFYGLLHQTHNRFYVLHYNFSLIKFLQLLLSKNYQQFTCIHFTQYFDFSQHTNIDNNDCHNWGGTAVMTKHLYLDIDFGAYGGIKQLIPIDASVPFDVELQKKIMFLTKLLTDIDTIIHKLKAECLAQKSPRINGIKESKKYFQILLPNDTDVIKLLNLEEEKLIEYGSDLEGSLEDTWHKFLKIVWELPLNENDLDYLKMVLQQQLSSAELFKNHLKYVISLMEPVNPELSLKLNNVFYF